MTVKQRQHLLAYLGYYVGDIDGIWGTLSKTACKAFQEDFQGIESDSFGGPETDKALRHAVAYDMFQVTDTIEVHQKPPDAGGTFWDEIKYFTREEFKCKCGQYHDPYCNGYPAEMKEAVVRIADDARENFGAPGYIVSGLRCELHNADSDGVCNSPHMYGEAVDMRIDGVSADRLLAYIQTRPGVRYAYAINGTNVHFDIPKGSV